MSETIESVKADLKLEREAMQRVRNRLMSFHDLPSVEIREQYCEGRRYTLIRTKELIDLIIDAIVIKPPSDAGG